MQETIVALLASFDKDDEGIDFVASVNGKRFYNVNEALSYASEKETYTKLHSDILFTPDEYLYCDIYSNGFSFGVAELSTERTVAITTLGSPESSIGYSVSVPLFALVRENGSYIHYYNAEEFTDISYNYTQEPKWRFLNNDTLILYGDITLDRSFEVERSSINPASPMNICFDLNGHSFTSTAEQAFVLGNDKNSRFYENFLICPRFSASSSRFPLSARSFSADP